jgi:hypothetical protein
MIKQSNNGKQFVSVLNEYFISDHIRYIIIIYINMEPVDRQPNGSCNSHIGNITVVTSPINHILAFSDIPVSKEDLKNIGRQVKWLILEKCISDKWQQIMRKVADLIELTELSITRCGLRDEHIQPLAKMAHLRRLVLGRVLLT